MKKGIEKNCVAYQNHGEIPSILGKIYKAGLVADRISDEKPITDITLPEVIERRHIRTKRNYMYKIVNIWDIMQKCRNEGVPANFVEKVEWLLFSLPEAN